MKKNELNITLDLPEELRQMMSTMPEMIKACVWDALKEFQNTQGSKPLTIKELAQKLQVSRVTISNWVKNDKIPSKVIGGRRYFILSEVLESAPTPKGKAQKR